MAHSGPHVSPDRVGLTARRRILQVFTTAPAPAGGDGRSYLHRVTDVARWSERYGCGGIVIPAESRLVDPWLVAAALVRETERLVPLLPVQPAYQHPYTVARLVASIGGLYGRRVALNLIAGGFRNELRALGDVTPHEQRYARLLEFALIVKRLLNGDRVSLDGTFYDMQGLRLVPSLDAALYPSLFVSGASESALAAARQLDAAAIGDPRPPDEEQASEPVGPSRAVRLGIIAREDADLAWSVAFRRFPPDPRERKPAEGGDAPWRRHPSPHTASGGHERSPYWFVPFEHYRTFHPYLVGSYDQVVTEICRYVHAGFQTFLLDVPADEEELTHWRVVFERSTAVLHS